MASSEIQPHRASATSVQRVAPTGPTSNLLKIFVCGPFKGLIDSETGVVPDAHRLRLASVIGSLERAGHTVISAHKTEGWGSVSVTPPECTLRDFRWVHEADVVVAFPGAPPSPGTHVEIGWASALGKPLVIVLEDGVEHAYLVLGLVAFASVSYVTYRNSSDFLSELGSRVNEAVLAG